MRLSGGASLRQRAKQAQMSWGEARPVLEGKQGGSAVARRLG